MTAQRRTRRVDVPLAYNTKETTILLSKTTQPPVDSIHRTWTPPPHSLPCQRLKSSILNHNDTVIEVVQLFSLIRCPITTFRFVMVGFIVFCTNHDKPQTPSPSTTLRTSILQPSPRNTPYPYNIPPESKPIETPQAISDLTRKSTAICSVSSSFYLGDGENDTKHLKPTQWCNKGSSSFVILFEITPSHSLNQWMFEVRA